MSSRSSSTTNQSMNDSVGSVGAVVRKTHRSHLAKDFEVEEVKRVHSNGRTVTVINHNTRGYDKNEPTPGYGQILPEKKKRDA